MNIRVRKTGTNTQLRRSCEPARPSRALAGAGGVDVQGRFSWVRVDECRCCDPCRIIEMVGCTNHLLAVPHFPAAFGTAVVFCARAATQHPRAGVNAAELIGSELHVIRFGFGCAGCCQRRTIAHPASCASDFYWCGEFCSAAQKKSGVMKKDLRWGWSVVFSTHNRNQPKQ